MKVAVLMGSDSDYDVVSKGLEILKSFEIPYVVRVLSAHRTPDDALGFSKNAEAEGFEVIIAAAGKAAHLPGVLAAVTPLPVIGLPVYSSTFDGMDALLAMVQMPKGIPVATVAVNGAENAALLAAQILGVKYPELREKMKAYKEQLAREVREKDRLLQEKLNQ